MTTEKQTKSNRIVSYFEVYFNNKELNQVQHVANFTNENEANHYANFLNKLNSDLPYKYLVRPATLEVLTSATELTREQILSRIEHIQKLIYKYEDHYEQGSYEVQVKLPQLEKKLQDLNDTLLTLEASDNCEC